MGRDKPGKPRRERPSREPEDELSGVWSNSEVDPVTGRYGLSLSYEGDVAWSFTPDEGWAYVRMLTTVLARATHDAAVFKQLVATGAKREHAGAIVALDLRPDRRPVDQVGPIRFEAGATIEGKPFITLSLPGDEKPRSQWEVEDVRHHLLGVMEAIETAELDDRLRHVLTHTIDLDDGKARAFVHLLRDYRA